MSRNEPGTDAAALRQLHQLIRSGRYPLNSRLPPERELAVALGVGRSTLRKALARLEAEGSIWRHVGRGTFVGAHPIPIKAQGRLGPLLASPKDVMEARLMFEPAIAAAAARHATRADIDYMRRCVEKSDSASDWVTYELWDCTLHRAIAAATRNPLAELFMETVNDFRKEDDWGRHQLPAYDSERQRRSASQHRRVVEAISARDPRAAAEIMHHHLTMVRGIYFDEEPRDILAHDGNGESQPSGEMGNGVVGYRSLGG